MHLDEVLLPILQQQRLANELALGNVKTRLDEFDDVGSGDPTVLSARLSSPARISHGLSLGVSATTGADARAVNRARGVARSSQSRSASTFAPTRWAAASLSTSLPLSWSPPPRAEGPRRRASRRCWIAPSAANPESRQGVYDGAPDMALDRVELGRRRRAPTLAGDERQDLEGGGLTTTLRHGGLRTRSDTGE